MWFSVHGATFHTDPGDIGTIKILKLASACFKF